MRTIALETSSTTGSIALFEEGRLIAESDLGRLEAGLGQRTAQSLAPTLDSILRDARWEPRDVRLIAVTDGPGSFTGLRVGVTTAKVMAYVSGAEVVAVNTLEVIAAQADIASDRLWVVMDAQRQQVFAARFAVTRQGSPQVVSQTQILDNDAWLRALADGDAVTGTGLARLATRVPAGVQVIASEAWSPQSATLGRLALAKYASGFRTDYWTLVPQYYRKSAAEEKFEQGT